MTNENKDPFKMAYDEMMKDNPEKALAFSLFEQAHESGDPRATYAIATWYLHGRYVKKNINSDGVRYVICHSGAVVRFIF